jgi:tight adherence protein C
MFVRLPALRRPSLDDRLAPYLRDAARPSRLLERAETVTPFPTLERIVGPVLADATRLLERWLGGGGSVRSRLDRLGSSMSLEAFRVEQLLWGGLGLLAGVAVSLLLLAAGQVRQPIALVLLSLLCGVAGVLCRDRRLTTAVGRREERMMAEFPDSRFGDGVAVAVERGTPLADGPARSSHGRSRSRPSQIARHRRPQSGHDGAYQDPRCRWARCWWSGFRSSWSARSVRSRQREDLAPGRHRTTQRPQRWSDASGSA